MARTEEDTAGWRRHCTHVLLIRKETLHDFKGVRVVAGYKAVIHP